LSSTRWQIDAALPPDLWFLVLALRHFPCRNKSARL
jgi:hypothetical protein